MGTVEMVGTLVVDSSHCYCNSFDSFCNSSYSFHDSSDSFAIPAVVFMRLRFSIVWGFYLVVTCIQVFGHLNSIPRS